MSRVRYVFLGGAGAAFLLAMIFAFLEVGSPLMRPLLHVSATLLLAISLPLWNKKWVNWIWLPLSVGVVLAAVQILTIVEVSAPASFFAIGSFLLMLLGLFFMSAVLLSILSEKPHRFFLDRLAPIIFGLMFLYFWEVIVLGFQVPKVLLPAPSDIGVKFVTEASTLWGDFRVTFLRAAIAGFFIGNALGIGVALAIDRLPFLQRGLLPLGNLVSAIPIVGIAPIMVMWFGFGWQSKTAVIVVMIFFPMLVNMLIGLKSSDRIQLDLMRSYGASYIEQLWRLRIPNALPFIFNALKVNSTLALIGAIVAEFFGSPIAGMGFRISVEVGRLNVEMVWATIAVAALAGSTSYAILAGIERIVTHWHPSYRSR